MPLSAKFRREMLTAMKIAKKNKESQSELDSTENEISNNEDERNTSILTKPVSSSQPLSIDTKESSNIKNPDKHAQ